MVLWSVAITPMVKTGTDRKTGAWSTRTPLAGHFCHSAVGPDSHIKDGLQILWRVRHESTVIRVLQLDDLLSGQFSSCLQPLDVEEVSIQSEVHCRTTAILKLLMEKHALDGFAH